MYILIFIYLIIGIIVAFRELDRHKKFIQKYPTYPETFTLLEFIVIVFVWPFILSQNIEL